MQNVGNRFFYEAFGLAIASDIPLPELPLLSKYSLSLDVEINLQVAVEHQSLLDNNPYEHIVKNHTVLFYIPDQAYYSIKEGSRISVSIKPGADESLVRLYILGSCMGALLMQRRMYPLHGSAVEINGKAYAFIGQSGAGKSTLASSFLSLGYRLVSDDVISVTLSDGIPMVAPSYPQQKLWQQSLEYLGLNEHSYPPIFGREDKYSIPVTSNFRGAPLPLGGIFELIKDDVSQVEIQPILKLERFQTLSDHTYRNFLIQPLGLLEWHFSVSAGIMAHLDMYRIIRPNKGYSAPQLVEFILNNANEFNKQLGEVGRVL